MTQGNKWVTYHGWQSKGWRWFSGSFMIIVLRWDNLLKKSAICNWKFSKFLIWLINSGILNCLLKFKKRPLKDFERHCFIQVGSLTTYLVHTYKEKALCEIPSTYNLPINVMKLDLQIYYNNRSKKQTNNQFILVGGQIFFRLTYSTKT